MKKLIELSKNPNSFEFKKELYDYYVDNNYNNKAIRPLEYKLGIDFTDLKKYLDDYVKNELKMSKEKFEEYKKKEKEKNKDKFLGKTNEILKKEGITTNFLYRNNVEKNIFLKGLYNILNENDFDLDICRELADEYKITTYHLSLTMKNYILTELNISVDDLSENTRFFIFMGKGDFIRISNFGLRDIYRNLINAKNENEVVDIIKNSSYEFRYINNNFRLYEKYYIKSEIEVINKWLDEYTKVHLKEKQENSLLYKENKRLEKMKEDKEKAKKIIQDYLKNSNYNFNEFLAVNNISNEKFKEYLEIVKVFEKDLYNEFENTISVKKEENKNNTENIIRLLEEGILNGYEENDVHRDFDLLDYFIITKIPVSKMNSLNLNKITKQARDYLHSLKIKYTYVDKESQKEVEDIMNTRRIVGVEFDKNNNIIPGTGREITENEKKGILKYLSDNEIVANRITYNIALKRYLNGFIDLKETKKLSLNNK